jgi:hypothetical protein
MKRTQITIPENVFDVLRRRSKHLGVTPNILCRLQLCQLNALDDPGDSAKSYLIELENWREIELYVEARGYKSIGFFLQKTAGAFMKKYHITEAQKADAGKSLKGRKRAPACQSATS